MDYFHEYAPGQEFPFFMDEYVAEHSTSQHSFTCQAKRYEFGVSSSQNGDKTPTINVIHLQLEGAALPDNQMESVSVAVSSLVAPITVRLTCNLDVAALAISGMDRAMWDDFLDESRSEEPTIRTIRIYFRNKELISISE
ncbi:MAG: hypothetical protein DCF28_09565 [Alphaproteobacteria bacterium]|nr:MAG: hypothetical protein DCF28_09565 [Alphaproteobacteria bacterium]PZO39532.1 MAG: hypothetical protein DCE92_04125 [Alphaproteobacteria bacterium]